MSSFSPGPAAPPSGGPVAAHRETVDALFGAGGFERLNGAMGLLGSRPELGHAGRALGYVINQVASRAAQGELTDVDRGAVEHAIVQLQALIHARRVSPEQARQLGGVIGELQGALG